MTTQNIDFFETMVLTTTFITGELKTTTRMRLSFTTTEAQLILLTGTETINYTLRNQKPKDKNLYSNNGIYGDYELLFVPQCIMMGSFLLDCGIMGKL